MAETGSGVSLLPPIPPLAGGPCQSDRPGRIAGGTALPFYAFPQFGDVVTGVVMLGHPDQRHEEPHVAQGGKGEAEAQQRAGPPRQSEGWACRSQEAQPDGFLITDGASGLRDTWLVAHDPHLRRLDECLLLEARIDDLAQVQ